MADVSADSAVILGGVVVKPQPDPQWWPQPVAERAREVVPSGVQVRAYEDWLRGGVEVRLSESWWWRVARWLGLTRAGRGSVLARVSIELSDSPVGVPVRVGWE